ncbi:hypothetical protein NGA_0135000 [Nannochloropsis gaditana CCMP526]|nr:hypothetical protein NGA_0135000 [Nannochloropsis gaditana CCMP526]EKU20965.1 hypothetical protein NGA_0135000 [Nannochloropsis gaditana CCMP526]|eukprot:XP_005855402.1 hypothetical protein NGA_0135000 [Nannochloropsis gaditana CCMP526]
MVPPWRWRNNRMEENVSRETFDRVYVRSLAPFIGVVSL